MLTVTTRSVRTAPARAAISVALSCLLAVAFGFVSLGPTAGAPIAARPDAPVEAQSHSQCPANTEHASFSRPAGGWPAVDYYDDWRFYSDGVFSVQLHFEDAGFEIVIEDASVYFSNAWPPVAKAFVTDASGTAPYPARLAYDPPISSSWEAHDGPLGGPNSGTITEIEFCYTTPPAAADCPTGTTYYSPAIPTDGWPAMWQPTTFGDRTFSVVLTFGTVEVDHSSLRFSQASPLVSTVFISSEDDRQQYPGPSQSYEPPTAADPSNPDEPWLAPSWNRITRIEFCYVTPTAASPSLPPRTIPPTPDIPPPTLAPTAVPTLAPTLPPTLMPTLPLPTPTLPLPTLPLPTPTLPLPTPTLPLPTRTLPLPTITAPPTQLPTLPPATGTPTQPPIGPPTFAPTPPTPTIGPTAPPTALPSLLPSPLPTPSPTATGTAAATATPTIAPTALPTATPPPTAAATGLPTLEPTPTPPADATPEPTPSPSEALGPIVRLAGGIPPASQVVVDPAAIGFSLLLVLLFLLLALFPASLFNETIEENYEVIAGWFARGGTRAARLRGLISRFWHGWFGVTFFLLLSGVIYGFLDPAFGLDADSLALFAGIVVGLAITTAAFELPIVLVQRRINLERGIVRVLPLTILIALACVLVSRIAEFQPGYLYGLVAFWAFERALPRRSAGLAVAMTCVVILVMALGAWVLLPEVTTALAGAPLLATFAATVLAVIFIGGLEGLLVELVPIRFLRGQHVWAWRKSVWLVLFGIGGFAFVHILLHPGVDYLFEARGEAVAVAVAFFIGFALLSVVTWGYFRYVYKPSTA